MRGSTTRRRRSTPAQTAGAERAAYLARRIGTALREARRALGLRQADVAARADITQAHVSRIERGLERGASLSTLASCAAAVGTQLAAFVEARPGADLPRDLEHLRRQQLVISMAARGGWTGQPEVIVAEDGVPPRSIDVLLARPAVRECAVTEIWNLMTDVGGAMRGLDAKVVAMQRQLGPEWRVAGLLVVPGTRRNRALVRDLAALFRARYPASSRAWLAALTDPAVPMPAASGFLWTSVRGDELIAARPG